MTKRSTSGLEGSPDDDPPASPGQAHHGTLPSHETTQPEHGFGVTALTTGQEPPAVARPRLPLRDLLVRYGSERTRIKRPWLWTAVISWLAFLVWLFLGRDLAISLLDFATEPFQALFSAVGLTVRSDSLLALVMAWLWIQVICDFSLTLSLWWAFYTVGLPVFLLGSFIQALKGSRFELEHEAPLFDAWRRKGLRPAKQRYPRIPVAPVVNILAAILLLFGDANHPIAHIGALASGVTLFAASVRSTFGFVLVPTTGATKRIMLGIGWATFEFANACFVLAAQARRDGGTRNSTLLSRLLVRLAERLLVRQYLVARHSSIEAASASLLFQMTVRLSGLLAGASIIWAGIFGVAGACDLGPLKLLPIAASAFLPVVDSTACIPTMARLICAASFWILLTGFVSPAAGNFASRRDLVAQAIRESKGHIRLTARAVIRYRRQSAP